MCVPLVGHETCTIVLAMVGRRQANQTHDLFSAGFQRKSRAEPGEAAPAHLLLPRDLPAGLKHLSDADLLRLTLELRMRSHDGTLDRDGRRAATRPRVCQSRRSPNPARGPRRPPRSSRRWPKWCGLRSRPASSRRPWRGSSGSVSLRSLQKALSGTECSSWRTNRSKRRLRSPWAISFSRAGCRGATAIGADMSGRLIHARSACGHLAQRFPMWLAGDRDVTSTAF